MTRGPYRLYAIGGSALENPTNQTGVLVSVEVFFGVKARRAEVYDVAQDTWRVLGTLPKGVVASAVGAVGAVVGLATFRSATRSPR